jgi:hypothetical protein
VSRRDVVDQVADTLQMAWTALIAPDWPQLQAISNAMWSTWPASSPALAGPAP